MKKRHHKRIHGSSDLSTATPHGLTIIRVVVTLLWYDTIGIICHCDHQSTAQLMLIALLYFLLTHGHVSTSAPAPCGFLFAGKMDPVCVTKITQWVIDTLNRFRYWNAFTRRGKMGVNMVVSLDCNENTCRNRMFWNKRENKHIVVGSQPCYSWNGTGTSSSLA